jgi:hypothetical protein
MICFDKIIAVLLSEMASSGHQLTQHTRIGRCLVHRHRARLAAVIQGPGKEPTRGCQVPPLRHQDIDDLAILVNRSVQVDPPIEQPVARSSRSRPTCRSVHRGRAASLEDMIIVCAGA